jgi:S1-C subfamily serine protease
MPRTLPSIISLISLTITLACGPVIAVAQTSPRETDTVRLVRKCLPTVVSIRTTRKHPSGNGYVFGMGSGSVIHPAGYVLTNSHVIDGAVEGDVLLHDGNAYRYRVVAQSLQEDMALLKIDAGKPLTYMTLGRSDDLMLGEPVVVIGNPNGLANSVSTGIVSGLNRSQSRMIQTSAAINGGNSGGPLINALGHQIGIITSKHLEAENIGFAITIDRAREMFPRMIASEQRYGVQMGITVDVLASTAKVSAVTANSPAAKAGIQVGDVIHQAGGLRVQHGLDYHIALIGAKPGKKLPLELVRGNKRIQIKPTFAPLPLPKPVSAKGTSPGLAFSYYQGQWQRLPDFKSLTPTATGMTPKPTLDLKGRSPEYFGFQFTGLIKAPADGLYTFYAASDDGSRLWIGDKLVVDNDGLHSHHESAGLIRLKAGLYPITIGFFEFSGGESLVVSWKGPKLKKQEILPAAFFFKKKSETNKAASK